MCVCVCRVACTELGICSKSRCSGAIHADLPTHARQRSVRRVMVFCSAPFSFRFMRLMAEPKNGDVAFRYHGLAGWFCSYALDIPMKSPGPSARCFSSFTSSGAVTKVSSSCVRVCVCVWLCVCGAGIYIHAGVCACVLRMCMPACMCTRELLIVAYGLFPV